MIQICRIVFFIMCAMAAVGCTSRIAERQLTQAESLMDQSPDSALTLLNAIDSRPLKGELRARHALLLSQAYDKNYIDVADDSLINIAFDYYRNTDDDRRLMQAAYYKSVVIHNAKNYLQSMKYGAMADSLAVRLKDHKFAGLSASILLFNSAYLHSRKAEIDYGYKARKHFLLAGDTVNANIISNRLAFDLMNALAFDASSDIIETLPESVVKSQLQAYLYCMVHDEEKLDSMLRILPELQDESWMCSERAWGIIESGGNLQEAHRLLDHALANASLATDTTLYNWVYAELAKVEGRFDDYIEYKEWYEQKLERSNSYYQHLMTPHVYGEGINILHERDMDIADKDRTTLYNLLVIAVVIAVLLGLLIVILALNNSRKKAIFSQKIYALQAEYNKLNDSYEVGLNEASSERNALIGKIDELKAQIGQQTIDVKLNSQIELMLTLSSLYKYAGSNNEQDKIARQIRNHIAKFKEKDFISMIINKVNSTCENLIDKIREDKVLKDSDLDILLYTYAGFSVNVIAVITNNTPNFVSVRRFRIRERMQNAGFDEEFLCKPLNFLKNL